MSRRLAGLAGLTTLLLVACGGGGGGGTTPPPSTRTLSGTISSLAGQVSDSDVKDANGPQVSNDDAATAQVIPNAVTVGGWAGPTDTLDWFKVSLSAGQSVTLTISDAAAEDLDLFLVRQDDPNTVVASSEQAPPAAVETVNVPATAAYYVVVQWLDSTALTPKGSSYLLTLGTGPASAPASLSVAREFVPGEVLVRFRPNQLALAAQGGLEARAAAMGLRVLDGAADREVLLSMGDGSAAGRAAALAALGAPADRAVGPWSRVTDAVTEAKLDTLAAIKALRRRADVATADPNYIFHPEAVPDDPAYQFQWHYPLINLPQAWEVSKGGATVGNSVVVAVVDTGVYLNHPDLAGKLVNGYDFISSPTVARDATGRDPDPDDPGDAAIAGQSSFHGTHVAGTIAAATGNGVGVAGVGWNTRVMPVRVLGAGGGTSADILAALRWLAGTGGATPPAPAVRPAVINLSLGCLDCGSATEQAVYDELRTAGIIVVAAAGNENSPLKGYPASYANVISVAAVDSTQARAPYSNFNSEVDVAAPGGNMAFDRNGDGYADGVLSTGVDDSSGTRVANYRFLQGTSMASPHMAGVVALMKANCPGLTPGSLDTLLASGAITTDLGTAGKDDTFGWGLIDAFKAVTACGAAAAQPVLGVTPRRVDAAALSGPFTLTAANVSGVGTLPTVTAAVTAGADWLVLTPAAAPSGLGDYAVTIVRGTLPAGSYAGAVTFTAGAQSVVVPVTMRVGAAAAPAGVGFVYVLLLDDTGAVVDQDGVAGAAGSYAFGFTGVPDGTYAVVAGTDLDDDTFICDAGEACGAWPTLGTLTPFTVDANLTGLDFGVGFDVGVGGLATGAADGPAGWRRLPVRKSLGGGR